MKIINTLVCYIHILFTLLRYTNIFTMNYNNISNSELTFLIDEWIHSERDRKILKRRLIDGICYEKLAEEFNLSTRHTYEIVQKNLKILAKYT